MSKTSILALTLASFAFPTLPAIAAPAATQQEADTLKSLFERYVGHPAAGEASSVTVVPEGGSYRTSFDYKQIMRPLESFGLSIDPASQTLSLTPNDNGTWHLVGDAMPPITMHLKDQTIALKASTYKYDGTYDPKLAIFTDQTITQDGSSVDQDAPAVSQHRRVGHSSLIQKGAPAGADRADTDVHYMASDLTGQMTMRAPSPEGSVAVEPGGPPTQFSYSLSANTLDVHIDNLRPQNILNLWAFFVAHPHRDAITANQEELRGLLKAALPMLTGLKEGATGETLAVETQMGTFKAAKIGGSVDISGLSGAATIASILSIDGLVVPSAILPPWSVGLLPTTIDLRPSVNGVHVDEGAHEAVDTFDLKHDGFTPDESQKIGHIFWPGDGKVTLAPSRITSSLLDLKLEGEATLGAMPAGRLSVIGAGLDKAIGALQAVSDTDPTAGQILAQMVAAKSLAKANPDGSLTWVIEASAGGAMSVNGVPMK